MRRKLHLILFLLFVKNLSYSQPTGQNLDFESGGFTNWSGWIGTCCPITFDTIGIVNGRHTIMNGSGFDPHCFTDIPVVAPDGGNYSLRLGNDDVNNEADAIQYFLSVTNQSNLLSLNYAVVFEDPSHTPSEQPRFELVIYDILGTNIPCGFYSVTAASNLPGFLSNGSIRYKKWSMIGFDLSQYIGQNLTIELRTGDCSLGGHFGYAYIDASCGPLHIHHSLSADSLTDTLKAPEGFISYLWSNGDSLPYTIVPVSNQTINYSVTIMSVDSCVSTISTSVTIGVPEIEFESFKLYPNPSNGFINLEVENPIGLKLKIINVTGQVVIQKAYSKTIDISSLQNGVYTLHLFSETRTFKTQRIIVE